MIRTKRRRVACAGLLLALGLQGPSPVHAHPMTAQHGTLNLVGDGAFLVLSLPISAFGGIDDDGDGGLSASEFEAHRAALAEAVLDGARLLDERGARPLEGLMLAPSSSEADHSGPATQLTVMGRYALADPTAPLRFELSLHGATSAERAVRIRATRRATNDRRWLTFTPATPVRALFARS